MSAFSIMEPLNAMAAIDARHIPESARRIATFSLFDWMVVARAGRNEPVSQIIRSYVTEEGGKPDASLVGSSVRVPARAAALANGAVSHALDYDDTHFAHIGHPSVAVLPAALAAAEQVDASAAALRDAFLLGAEASCRIGMVLGRAHYQRGFHQTATSGAFGATIAAGRLLGLTPTEMRHALSLVSTRAAGLKSQFGTMGKPFNAGIAATNGVEAASLAKRGLVSCDDGLSGEQGFVETHSDQPDRETPWHNPPPRTFVFEDIKYKLHACCHGTHAMIEALLAARQRHDFTARAVTRIEVRTHPRWLRVCAIEKPRTGLEAKFSYALLASMVLEGLDTSSEKTFDDALCTDPELGRLAARVIVSGDDRLSETEARVALECGDDERFVISHDLAARMPEEVIERKLRAKARGLLGETEAGALWAGVAAIDLRSARDLARLLNECPAASTNAASHR
jgi:2-methylcitrate dehydratase PrpD